MEAGRAASAEAQTRLLRRTRRLLAAAAKGLLTGAVISLALLSTRDHHPEMARASIARTAFAAVIGGAVNLLASELLAGPLDSTGGERALEFMLEVAAFLGAGSPPAIFAVLPGVGGTLAVLLVVAATVAAIAAAAAATQAAAAGITVILACGLAFAAQCLLNTKLAA